jgi:hypothetical protein
MMLVQTSKQTEPPNLTKFLDISPLFLQRRLNSVEQNHAVHGQAALGTCYCQLWQLRLCMPTIPRRSAPAQRAVLSKQIKRVLGCACLWVVSALGGCTLARIGRTPSEKYVGLKNTYSNTIISKQLIPSLGLLPLSGLLLPLPLSSHILAI